MLYSSSIANEDNAAGKAFEKSTCRSINSNVLKDFSYINALTIDQVFANAEKYGVSIPGRVEDYPDICIRNSKNGKFLFVECKERLDANVANLKFKLEDNAIKFVYGKTHIARESKLLDRLADDIQNSQSWKEFQDFMHAPNDDLDGARPLDAYVDQNIATQQLASQLADKVNANREKYCTSANIIPDGVFASTTLPTWTIALAWKLSDMNPAHVYDICTIDIDYMSDLLKEHYQMQKKAPAYYIQAADNLYQLFDSNPLHLKANGQSPMMLPDMPGRYTLKFTPRISNPQSMKMYFDTRSNFTEDLPMSNMSFNALDSSRLPAIDLN